MQHWTILRILWPSFLVAGMTGAVVFALLDPLDLIIMGSIQADRTVVYTASFFLFWLMAALSSALTLRLVMPGDAPDEDAEPPA